jgi:acyl carrier protein phosphodiesterase
LNYLAHLYLAQRNPHSLVGNLMGDFLRGVKVKDLPQRIACGVHNHLAVDRYTDSHTCLKPLKAMFSAQRRRFAPIIIDVVFDHFLIKHWRDYSQESLADFTDYCYWSFTELRNEMPAAMQQKVAWIIHYDLLNSYARLPGVGNALNGISRRIRFENQLAGAVDEVTRHYEALEKGFREFFPTLCDYIRELEVEATSNVEHRSVSSNTVHVANQIIKYNTFSKTKLRANRNANNSLVYCQQYRRLHRPS